MSGWWHEERIRQRAYEIWEREGRPTDSSLEHWLRAEAEIKSEEEGLQQDIELEAEGAV